MAVIGQVKEQASNTLVIIYQHVGEGLRSDLAKKDIHPTKYVTLSFLLLYEGRVGCHQLYTDFYTGFLFYFFVPRGPQEL